MLSKAISYKPKNLLKLADVGISGGCSTLGFHALFEGKTDKFSVSEYKVTTEDGYILQMFRINLTQNARKNLKNESKKNLDVPVLIVHGLEDSADGWFYNDEENSPGFYLVNKGYDVWIGNNRGNKYSHSHTNPNISKKDFFNFCYDDLGLYDVKAFYNQVLTETKKDKLLYFGHSQGTSQMFVAGCDYKTRDYIKDHTLKFFALAPVVFLNNMGSNVLDFAAKFNGLIWDTAQVIASPEFAPASCDIDAHNTFVTLAQYFCDAFKIFCDSIVPGFNFDEKVDNALDNLQRLSEHVPSGSSFKCVEKYAQSTAMKEKKVFQKFDYGFLGNLYHYWQHTPPKWDVSKWDIDTVLIAATRDEFATVPDVFNLQIVIENTQKVRVYTIEEWDHYTFLFARDMNPLREILDKELP